jgi:2-polyprenyl-3-methyl-5-hydroxy-6-metoxy-1,4-benzoquinol methylase
MTKSRSKDALRDEDDPLAVARNEVEKASRHYYHTPTQLGIDNRIKQLIVERCAPFVKGPAILELGYIDGLWTDAILRQNCDVDIVEGASRHIEHARNRYAGNPRVRVIHKLFQEFEPDKPYNTIVAGDMLGCLPDARGFLKRACGWIREGGHLLATVPNSRSLHRRVGSLMNLEATPTELNQRYREVGVYGSYDRYELRHVLLQSGFEIKTLRGCFLKPLPSAQMENWSDELLRAFLDVGDELEDYCYYLYAVCRKQHT